MDAKTKILFDGNCIVCDSEIAHYKRLAPGIFELVDITSSDFDAAKYGLTSEAVQLHMHVMTPEGHILMGVDAFSHIWSLLKYYKLAAKAIKLPLVYSAAVLGYHTFAKYRHLLPKKDKKV